MSIISLVTSLATQQQRQAKSQVLKSVKRAKDNRTQKRNAQEVLERYGDMRANGWHGEGERNQIKQMMEGLGFSAAEIALVDDFDASNSNSNTSAGLNMASEAGQNNLRIADQIERKFENLVEKFDDEDAEIQSKLKLSVSDYQNAQTENNEALKKEAQARKSIGQAWSSV